MTQDKIYISGPMTGYPELNFPAFQNAMKQLKELGYAVISPHEITLPDYPPEYKPKTPEDKLAMWLAFMRADIKALMECDTVATLSGWQDSKGARIEVNLAKDLGMKVIDINSLITNQGLAQSAIESTATAQ